MLHGESRRSGPPLLVLPSFRADTRAQPRGLALRVVTICLDPQLDGDLPVVCHPPSSPSESVPGYGEGRQGLVQRGQVARGVTGVQISSEGGGLAR